MPKEHIITKDDRRLQQERGGPVPAVRIGWQRGCAVQIDTVYLDGGEWANQQPEGQFVNLDRQAINQLIQVLRRARDQAYGKDE